MPRGTERFPIPPPEGGLVRNKVAPEIPDGFLWNGVNVVSRYGELRPRPGLTRVFADGPGGRVMGGAFYRTPAAAPVVVVATLTRWFSAVSGVWVALLPVTPFTGTADDQWRMTVFPTGTPTVNLLIGTNNVDAIQSFDPAVGSLAVLRGTPPAAARDICSADSYVVVGNVVEAGVRSPSRLRACAFNDPNTWPANFVWDLTSTDEPIVAVHRLGRTSFLAYKDESLWVGEAQAGTLPFRVEMLEVRPGPVSPAAVVDYGAQQFFLANDARIYRVSGFSVQAVSGPIERELQSIFSQFGLRFDTLQRAVGVYKKLDQSIWWFFPNSNSIDPIVAVSYQLDTSALHFHAFPVAITAAFRGIDITGSLRPTEYLGTSDGRVFRFEYDVDDAGTAITSSWEHPLRAWKGTAFRHRFDQILSSFEQVPGGPIVTVSVGASEALAELAPAYQPVGTHDTAKDTRQPLAAAVAIEGAFLNVRYDVSSSTRWAYRGAELWLWVEEAA